MSETSEIERLESSNRRSITSLVKGLFVGKKSEQQINNKERGLEERDRKNAMEFVDELERRLSGFKLVLKKEELKSFAEEVAKETHSLRKGIYSGLSTLSKPSFYENKMPLPKNERAESSQLLSIANEEERERGKRPLEEFLPKAQMFLPENINIAIVLPDAREALPDVERYLSKNPDFEGNPVVLAMSDAKYREISVFEPNGGLSMKKRKSLRVSNHKFFVGQTVEEVKRKLCDYIVEERKKRILSRISKRNVSQNGKYFIDKLINEQEMLNAANLYYGGKNKSGKDEVLHEQRELDLNRLLAEMRFVPEIEKKTIHYKPGERTIWDQEGKSPTFEYPPINVMTINRLREAGRVIDDKGDEVYEEQAESGKVLTAFKIPRNKASNEKTKIVAKTTQ